MPSRGSSDGWVAAVLTLASLALMVAPATAAERDRVRVSTTGNNSELVDRIPITKRSGVGRRVVMSLGPDRLHTLRSGDRLRVSSEVQLTVNCDVKSPRCVGPIYHYNPKARVELRLAHSRGAAGGKLLAPPKRIVCRQRLPRREHHCVIVFTKADLNIGTLRSLPCRPDRCFVNLVIDAYSSHAGRGDVLLVGGNRPDGSIPQDRGRVNAIVFSPGNGDYPKPLRSDARVRGALPLDLKPRVVYSQRLGRVRAGDQLEVTAAVFTSIRHLPYSAVTTTRVILAERRRATHSGALARRLGGGGEITESNGYNCTLNKPACISRKAGVLRITRDARSGGHLRPVYVNVVLTVGPKRRRARKGDRQRVLKRGGLEVTRYRQPRR
jgi:hypothetical protein